MEQYANGRPIARWPVLCGRCTLERRTQCPRVIAGRTLVEPSGLEVLHFVIDCSCRSCEVSRRVERLISYCSAGAEHEARVSYDHVGGEGGGAPFGQPAEGAEGAAPGGSDRGPSELTDPVETATPGSITQAGQLG